MALYLGPSSNFGYGNSPLQGGQPPRATFGQQPMSGAGQSQTVSTAPQQAPPNTLAAQAIRSNVPGGSGFDPSYLQNMASSIGSLFSTPGGGNMAINPLGNLNEISQPSGMEGNNPEQGLPQTWLQKALSGGGFSFNPPAAPVAPTTPRVAPTAPNYGGGGGRGNSFL